jgi:hypothetical protein
METNKIKVRPFKSTFSGCFYHKEDKTVRERFENQEEHLDFRYQIACLKLDGYYCIFDYDVNKTHCEIDNTGGIKNFIDPPFNLIYITRAIFSIQRATDVNETIEKQIPKQFY